MIDSDEITEAKRDKKQEMKQDAQEDINHHKRMMKDNDYFCEFTCENLQLKGNNIYLFDVLPQIEDWCSQFDNDVTANDILEWMKGDV